MGMNSFAPGSNECGQFIVRNISPQNKTISIFNYPINMGCTRDLLEIPGVGEADIKAALMKGQIRNKFKVGDIELVFSNIDLLQFNDCGIQYLEGYGFTTGVLVGYDQLDGYVQSLFGSGGGGGGGITPMEHETLRQLIHFIEIGGPGDGFATGAVRVINPSGAPFPTNITWYLDSTLTTKLVEKLIMYNSNNVPIVISYNMYDLDGVTIVHTVTDTITYTNNIFESLRNRSIS
jgi:hypothetical protein